MYPIKKMIVCLDQSPLDPTLIAYAGFLAKVNQVKKIYFTNVIKNFSLPKEVLDAFPSLSQEIVEERKSGMEKSVEALFPSIKGLEVDFVVKEGNLSKKILKLAEEKSVDLILIGRKVSLPGTGVASQRMARRATCSLLIVPENSKAQLTKLFLPTDFSDHSRNALEVGIAISKKYGKDIDIVFQHVISLPPVPSSDKTQEEFVNLFQKHAESSYKKFIRKIDTKGISITPIYTLDEEDSPVQKIVATALAVQADVLVLGAKGNTAATALHIGSMAERLIQYTTQLPLLLTRPKGKNAGVLDYLLEI